MELISRSAQPLFFIDTTTKKRNNYETSYHLFIVESSDMLCHGVKGGAKFVAKVTFVPISHVFTVYMFLDNCFGGVMIRLTLGTRPSF